MWFPVFVLVAGLIMVFAALLLVALWVVETIYKTLADKGYLPYIFGPLYRRIHWCREQVESGIRSLARRVDAFARPPKKGRRRRRRQR